MSSSKNLLIISHCQFPKSLLCFQVFVMSAPNIQVPKSVLASYYSYDNLPDTQQLKSNSDLLFCRQKSEIGLTELKPTCHQGCVPSEVSREESTFLSFPLSRDYLYSLAHGQITSSQTQKYQARFSHFYLSNCPSLFFEL